MSCETGDEFKSNNNSDESDEVVWTVVNTDDDARVKLEAEISGDMHWVRATQAELDTATQVNTGESA